MGHDDGDDCRKVFSFMSKWRVSPSRAGWWSTAQYSINFSFLVGRSAVLYNKNFKYKSGTAEEER